MVVKRSVVEGRGCVMEEKVQAQELLRPVPWWFTWICKSRHKDFVSDLVFSVILETIKMEFFNEIGKWKGGSVCIVLWSNHNADVLDARKDKRNFFLSRDWFCNKEILSSIFKIYGCCWSKIISGKLQEWTWCLVKYVGGSHCQMSLMKV